jgi:hypothetical protein
MGQMASTGLGVLGKVSRGSLDSNFLLHILLNFKEMAFDASRLVVMELWKQPVPVDLCQTR